jgi:hypothetical protein
MLPPGPAPAPPPAPGRKITQESAPVADDIKVGIELEGVGSVSTTWTRKAVIAQPNFHDVFKRMPLVRSKSYGDLRGVYIAPEDGAHFGTNSPAELVSRPHLLTAAELVNLRNSVWKAIRRKEFSTSTAQFKDPRAPAAVGPTATSRWGRATMVRVGGSLQTTIGVSVGKLLSDTAGTRAGVALMLVGDSGKRTGLERLAAAAVSAERYLAGTGIVAGSPARLEGLRLALFMAFLQPAMPSIPGFGHGWGKEAYGCNIKAESSFLACGISDLEFPLILGIKRTGRDAFKAALLAAMQTDGVNAQLIAALNTRLDVFKIGKPGSSLQTSVEDWYAIPNFLNTGHLYCVIEAREKLAPLNKKMAAYLNTSAPTKPPQPVSLGEPLYSTVTAAAATFQREVSAVLSS